jgi:tRNA (adenine57-N1/adenine58-N1)-methyltransferase
MSYGPLRAGEAVFFVDARGRKYLKELRAGHRITIRGSVIRTDDLIGQPEGGITDAEQAESFSVFRPSYAELATTIERAAEPIFAKDAGAIIIHSDIRAGDTLIEVGVGAGLLTIALLRAVGSEGRVISYELRPDFGDLAAKAVARYHGETPNWTLNIRNGNDGFDERGVDRVVCDVPEPDTLLDSVAAALRPGGTFASYVPTVLQFRNLREALEADPRFLMAQTIEVLERSWHVEDRSVRPDHRMVAHTGFLTFSRRSAA